MLDYLNADQVRRTLRRESEDVRDGGGETAARVRRRFSEEGLYVVKEIELRDEGRSFQERVRLFAPAELGALLEQAGFHVTDRFGDYAGHPLATDSPRAIFVGTRA